LALILPSSKEGQEERKGGRGENDGEDKEGGDRQRK
jgi:hypothetical protein